MLKNFFVALSLLILSTTLNAQFTAGIKGGLHNSLVNDGQAYTFNAEGVEALKLEFSEALYSFHGGLYAQAQLGKLIIRPELVYSSNKHAFLIEDLKNMNSPQIVEESYQQLDIPVLFGTKFGFVRINAGPVGHLHLNDTSDLVDFEGYSSRFKEMTYGWQGGIGFDIKRFSMDVRYEGNFNKFGDHITIGDTDFNFDGQANRFLASVGFSF